MRPNYKLRIDARGGVTRIPVPLRLEEITIKQLLTELDVGTALRLVLAMLMHILKLRTDSAMLSPPRAARLRNNVLRVVKTLAARDPAAPAEQPLLPMLAIAPARPQPVVAAPAAPVKTPEEIRFPVLKTQKQVKLPEPAAVTVAENKDVDSLSALSLAELREFARVAARDSKSMFEEALLAAYRKRLVAIFFGPFSVKQETDDVNFPDFRLICRGAQTIVLNRKSGAPGQTGEPDSYEMLRQCWLAARRPQHFRIEGTVQVQAAPAEVSLRN